MPMFVPMLVSMAAFAAMILFSITRWLAIRLYDRCHSRCGCGGCRCGSRLCIWRSPLRETIHFYKLHTRSKCCRCMYATAAYGERETKGKWQHEQEKRGYQAD